MDLNKLNFRESWGGGHVRLSVASDMTPALLNSHSAHSAPRGAFSEIFVNRWAATVCGAVRFFLTKCRRRDILWHRRRGRRAYI